MVNETTLIIFPNDNLRFKKALTATSFAAFNTTGSVPPVPLLYNTGQCWEIFLSSFLKSTDNFTRLIW